MIKYTFFLLSIILFSCGNNNSNSNSSSQNSSNGKSNDLVIGETLRTDYFEITISDVRLSDRVNTGNFMSERKPEKDNMFIIFKTKFKNIDTQSNYVNEGTVQIIDNGKEFEFDKSETFLLEGWGVFLDELNPLTTIETRLVFKLPKEINGKVYWVSDSDEKIFLGTITKQSITPSNEKPKEVIEKKEIEEVEIVEIETESEGIPTEEDFEEEEVKEDNNVAAAEITYYKINDPDGYSNLRDATSNGKIIRKVLESEKFEVISTENGYKKVKLYDGTIGYIHSSRVVKL